VRSRLCAARGERGQAIGLERPAVANLDGAVTVRRCSSRAFVTALREDVDQLRFVIDRMRCRGNFASTRYTVSDCQPEQTERPSACERTRLGAWRRDVTRWRLITYASTSTTKRTTHRCGARCGLTVIHS
jgi:hypothetical protein